MSDHDDVSGPEFSEMDVLVIIVDQLPLRQACALLRWYFRGDPETWYASFMAPASMNWWLKKNCSEISRIVAEDGFWSTL